MPYHIEMRKGHKNSKGESAPYCVVNEDTNQVAGSSPTKAEAEANMRALYANMSPEEKIREGLKKK